ncbi:hypothetical protein CCO03_13880 [Comamonas serinivorans]|uniref:Uncharacterized protein n=2 Tax=Comamonas serinivorans TaxID=1082851 RepID=A0A1Y0EPR2_9BURK|nr:hypothetical protein CCO03_13880 [Comamonas serinivorans]
MQQVPGLALAAGLAALAVGLGSSPWMRAHGLGALTLAVVLGLVVGNTVYPRLARLCEPGIQLSKSRLLRLGIVLFGLRITLADLGAVGPGALVVDALVIASTFGLACWLGIRVLRLEPRLALLIGAGSSICGAAAVVATTPVVKADSDQAAVAVATVVVFGTLAMFLYPALWLVARDGLALAPQAFGVYIGATVHEVAQVVAAGNMIGPLFTETALVTKLARVMMLAPFLLGLSAWLAWRDTSVATAPRGQPLPGHGAATHSHTVARTGGPSGRPSAPAGSRLGTLLATITIPWFAFGFLVAVAVHSTGVLPPAAVTAANGLADGLLAMAMAALGATTHLRAIRQAGPRAALLAAALFAWLVLGGGLLSVLAYGLG